MNFESALDWMRRGYRMRRAGAVGFIQKGIGVNDEPTLDQLANGGQTAWLPITEDLFAMDWEQYPETQHAAVSGFIDGRNMGEPASGR